MKVVQSGPRNGFSSFLVTESDFATFEVEKTHFGKFCIPGVIENGSFGSGGKIW